MLICLFYFCISRTFAVGVTVEKFRVMNYCKLLVILAVLTAGGCVNRTKSVADNAGEEAAAATDTVGVVAKWQIDSLRGDSIVAELISKGYEVWGFYDGVSVVCFNKCGIIDRSGNFVIPLKYDNIKSPTEGLAAVCTDDKWGAVDMRDSVVVEIKYDDVDYFHAGKSIVKTGGKYGVVDRTGKTVVQPVYDYIEPFLRRHGGGQVE